MTVADHIDDIDEPPKAAKGSKRADKPKQSTTAWTNTDVLLWLLKLDLKQFVPAFIHNNVTGSMLLKVEKDGGMKLDELLTMAEGAHSWSAAQLSGLRESILALQPRPEKVAAKLPDPAASAASETRARGLSLAEQYQALASGSKEEAGRKRQELEGGWSFEREKAEWLDYHRCFVERVVIEHMRARLNRIQEAIKLSVLLVSSLATVITSSSVGVSSSQVGSAAAAAGAGGVLNSFAHIWERFSPYLLLVFSLVTTVLSGFVQSQNTYWKTVEKASIEHIRYYTRLEEFYLHTLETTLEDRRPYDEYLALRHKLQHAKIDLPELNVAPRLRMKAIRRVKQLDGENWERGFTWLGYELLWPSEPYFLESLLMDFSRFQLGQHSLQHEDAQHELEEWQKMKEEYFKMRGLPLRKDRVALRERRGFCARLRCCLAPPPKETADSDAGALRSVLSRWKSRGAKQQLQSVAEASTSSTEGVLMRRVSDNV